MRSTVSVATAVLVFVGIAAGSASATTSESVFSMTTGGYSQTDQFNGAIELSDNVQSLLLNGTSPLSQLGVTVSSTTGADGSFDFEQNLYRVGTGSATLTTTLLDHITNSSPDSAFLRFDSQITPGHIAAQGNDSSNVVFFQFKIQQISGANGIATTLYTANGAISPNGAPSIQTSDGVAFNGLQSYSDGDGRALDWSATNLDLALQPIQSSTTDIIQYTITTYITGGVPCTDLSSCEGTQVAFGDPRNNGGVPMSQAALFDRPLDGSSTVPLIGEQFDPYTVTENVVPLDTPLPQNPPVLPPPNYPPPAPVPEPATWAMLAAGVALVGAFVRRRFASLVAVS